MRFELNEQGLERLLNDTVAEQFLMVTGERLAREWERNDPRNQPGGHEPPEISVNLDHERGVPVANVTTPDGLWHIIEFGSVNNPPYRPATKAAESIGIDLKDWR